MQFAAFVVKAKSDLRVCALELRYDCALLCTAVCFTDVIVLRCHVNKLYLCRSIDDKNVKTGVSAAATAMQMRLAEALEKIPLQ